MVSMSDTILAAGQAPKIAAPATPKTITTINTKP